MRPFSKKLVASIIEAPLIFYIKFALRGFPIHLVTLRTYNIMLIKIGFMLEARWLQHIHTKGVLRISPPSSTI
ncbi:hypothetical protein GOP47_0018532 [Adiantum capillus-veneris]|uniref:Uncharacterized protein n=1 Tax=Adiantum capillus-veneris TaxID=13818 RepID=A0A9D4UDA8_ADICA|nr:hypothetical protein GOP47_0018532 [Adiantum capillus-veneris]